jgi:3-carboxy-cis,cis-muconate cycloisomerase
VTLGPALGRQRAKEAVTRAVRDTEAGVPAAEALRNALKETGLTDGPSGASDSLGSFDSLGSLDELLDPERYLGAAEPLVDRAVHRAGAATDPVTPSKDAAAGPVTPPKDATADSPAPQEDASAVPPERPDNDPAPPENDPLTPSEELETAT